MRGILKQSVHGCVGMPVWVRNKLQPPQITQLPTDTHLLVPNPAFRLEPGTEEVQCRCYGLPAIKPQKSRPLFYPHFFFLFYM